MPTKKTFSVFIKYAASLAAVVCISHTADAIVTFDGGASTLVIEPGDSFAGDAVGYIELYDSNSNFLGSCSGSLLSSGTHVLTAAHCFDTEEGFLTSDVASVIVGWETLPDTFTFQVSSNFSIHPAYDQNPLLKNGYDIAVIELPAAAPTSVTRLDILRDSSGVEIGAAAAKIGYGWTGSGFIGEQTFDGEKRLGLNTVANWDDIEALTSDLKTDGSARLLGYDFDNTLGGSNLLGDAGFGTNEVLTARGDSGGPAIISFAGQNVIAGVTSFSLNSASFGLPSDTNPGNFSSWGDLAGDVRVVDPLNQNFIDLVVNQGRLIGDIDNDGDLDSVDIDALFDAIGGVVEPWFDLNLDGTVDTSDVDVLVEEIFQTRAGDANLDGRVDISDIAALSPNANQPGTYHWSDGNFNDDSSVDISDIAILSPNWGYVRDTSDFGNSASTARQPLSVPEPTAALLVLVMFTIVSSVRRR